MKSEFELKSLDLALQKLLNDGVLKNSEQKDKLYNLYKNDVRTYGLIHEEINKLRFDMNFLQKMLATDEKVKEDISKIDVTKKTEYTLSLENVTDFEKDGKSYIKIRYPYPSDVVRIIENRTNPHQTGKERFESILQSQGAMSVDGVINATSIFEQSLVKDCIEINMMDIKDVSTSTEYKKLSHEEKQRVYGTVRALVSSLPVADDVKRELSTKPVQTLLQILNKKIYISPSENIVVICDKSNPSKDETKTLSVKNHVTEDGRRINVYSLKPLDETGYRYNPDNNYQNTKNESQEPNKEEKSENDPEVIQEEDDIDKEVGQAMVPKAPWQKRKKQAAFISLLWSVILLGIISGALIAVLVKLY